MPHGKGFRDVENRPSHTPCLSSFAEISHNIYQITYRLPESKRIKSQLLKMDVQQDELMQIINRNFWGVALRKNRSNIFLQYRQYHK